MKKRILFAAISLMLAVFTLTGCFIKKPAGGGSGNGDSSDGNNGGTSDGGGNGGNGGNGSTPPANENILFSADIKLIVSDTLSDGEGECSLTLAAMIYDAIGKYPEVKKDSESGFAHEIILGKTNRELSNLAYRRLNRQIEDNKKLMGYVVYSDGESFAIAYDSVESLKLALNELEKTYLSPDYGKSTVPKGALFDYVVNKEELYAEWDAVIMQERWQTLKNEIDKEGYDGEATVAALQNLYLLYSDDIYLWMANLYDPELGGFYYSNSGRNTLGFLPDIESTMQVLNLIRYSGMNSSPNSYPEEFKNSIVEFIKSKQSSADGYFYHPQWEDLVISDERRGRDQMWALAILQMFGERPLYNSGGVTGSLGAPGALPASYMTSPLYRSVESQISRVVACSTLDHLSSESAFKSYLDSQNWADAYVTGNRIAAQVTSIKAAGLLDYCVQYLNGKQKANGMFDDQQGDYAVNGFLKIAAVYEAAGTVIPNSDKAAEFCLDVMLSDEPAGTVCWVYNVWYSFKIMISLLYDSNDSDNIMLADKIRDSLRKNAPQYIQVTAQKYSTFLKDDGSFSFNPDRTSELSQGMPVAVSGTNEGDVNGTYISSIGLTGYMFTSLGYNKVELYTENDYKLFINKIEGLKEIIKTGTASGGGISFDDLSNLNKVFHATSNVVTDFRPEEFDDEDPRSAYAVLEDEGEERGLVVEYGKPQAGLETRLEISNRTINKTRFIYEFDMKFMGGELEGGSWHTRFALYGNSKRFYYLLAYTLDDGTLALGDRNEPLAVLQPDKWYKLRFEYYTDTPDRACKVYVDGNYVGEGGTSDPSNGDGTLSRAFLEFRNEATGLLYRFDNILVSSDDEKYVPPAIDAGDAVGSHYKDASVKGKRYDYDVSDTSLPASLTGLGGAFTLIDGRLHFNVNAATAADGMIFELPISAAEQKYENLCKIFELEFSYGSTDSSAPMSFLLGNQEYSLVKDTASGGLNIVDKYNNGRIINTDLKPDTVYVLRFECYAYADNGRYNITKLYINEDYAGELRSSYNNAVTKLSIKMNGELAGTEAYAAVENVLIANVERAYERHSSEAPDDSTDTDSKEQSPFGGGDYYNGHSSGSRFDYTELADGLQTDGVTSGSDDTAMLYEGIFEYTRNDIKGESYMRWNHSIPSGLTSAVFIFETDFRFDGFMGNTPEQKLVFQAAGISHQVTPSFVEESGRLIMNLGKLSLAEGTWYNIRFELDYAAGMIYYFQNGEYKGADYLSKATTSNTRTLWYYMAKQTGGVMTFDNTFEGLVENGTLCEVHTDSNSDGKCDNCPLDMPKEEEPKPEPEIELPDNTIGGGSYYNGAEEGNRFDCGSVESGMQIDGVTQNDDALCTGGSFVFIRNNDTGSGESYIRWNHTASGALTTPVFIFETDFIFNNFAVDATTFQKIVIEANGIRHQITPSVSEDRQTLTIGKLTLTDGEWNNIRFELDYTAGMIYYFQNGEFKGSDYLEKGTTSGNRVLWYYMAKQTSGLMAFDNTFEGIVENGTLCEVHTDSNSDGKCDNCPLDMPKEEEPKPEPEIELPENTIGGGNYYNGQTEGNRFDCGSVESGMQIDGVTQNDDALCTGGSFVFIRNNDTGLDESYIRWNHSASGALTTPVFIFETDFIFNNFAVDATTFQKIVIEANGIRHQITPSVSEDRHTLTIGKLTLTDGEWNNIRFELDYTAGMIYYFQNGEFKGSDYLEKGTTSGNRVLWYYMAKQTGGLMAFDNTFEGIVENGTICDTHTDSNSDEKCDNCPLDMPKPPKPEIIIPENTVGGGSYYNGAEEGNRFDCGSVESGMQIDGVNSGDSAECKNGYFIFERNNDTGSGESYIRWNHSSPQGLETPVFVFETDFFFKDFTASSVSSQMLRIQVNGIEHKISPVLSSDRQTMTIGKLELSSETWYNIRMELNFAGGSINYFRDGVFVGSETLSSSSSSGTRVLWYYIAAQTGGVMVFDNTYQGFLEEGTLIQ